MFEDKDYICVDCSHFDECLREYDMSYEELSDCSICGNFEEYIVGFEI